MSSRARIWMLLLALLAVFTVPTLAGAAGHLPLHDTPPPEMSWITLTDSHGISVWSYRLSQPDGDVFSFRESTSGFMTSLLWGLALNTVAIGVFFLDWTMSMAWVETMSGAIRALGAAMQHMVDQIGGPVVLLPVAGLIVALLIATGNRSRGMWEFFAAALVVALSSSVLASPVDMVAGEDGLVHSAGTVGMEFAAGMHSHRDDPDGGGHADQVREGYVSMLVDTFVRRPHQMVNYGRVLDGGPCEAAFDAAMRDKPTKDVRKAVAECDKEAGEYADKPGEAMIFSAITFMVAALFVLGLTVVIAGALFYAGMTAMWRSLVVVVGLLVGVLPGGGRLVLTRGLADVATSCGAMVLLSVFLAGVLEMIDSVFSDTKDLGMAFFLTCLVIIVAIVALLGWRKKLAASADRAARWLAAGPGGKQQQRSERMKLWPVVSTVATLSHLRGRRNRVAGRQAPDSTTSTGATASGGTSGSAPPPTTPGLSAPGAAHTGTRAGGAWHRHSRGHSPSPGSTPAPETNQEGRMPGWGKRATAAARRSAGAVRRRVAAAGRPQHLGPHSDPSITTPAQPSRGSARPAAHSRPAAPTAGGAKRAPGPTKAADDTAGRTSTALGRALGSAFASGPRQPSTKPSPKTTSEAAGRGQRRVGAAKPPHPARRSNVVRGVRPSRRKGA